MHVLSGWLSLNFFRYMKNYRLIASLILLKLLLPVMTSAKSTLAERVDQAMLRELAEQELIGLAVGIISNGKILHINTYGLADRENNTPITRNTMFRWASVSKSITAVAGMQLWERGDLVLDNEPQRYVMEFPDKEANIKVWHLFCHMGGIVHYKNGKVIRTQREYPVVHPYESVIYALDKFKESPLINPPGTKFSYTTHGFILLSAVIERAGKQKFSYQVQNRIAKPMKMESLQPDYKWVNIPRRALGYRKRNGKIIVSTDTDAGWKVGGGGFISNIDDFAKFAAGLLNHRFVNPATRQKMWTPQQTKGGEKLGYGLGFSLNYFKGGIIQSWKPNGTGIKTFGHSGSMEKAKTLMILLPQLQQGVVVMSNSEYANSRKIAEQLLRIISSVD